MEMKISYIQDIRQGKVFKKLFILLILIYCSVSLYGQSVRTKLPNIVVIYVDDMGYGDLQSYGSEIPTPNIDRIGKDGIRFTDFYSAAPVCTPSRYALLTGKYPQRSKHNLTFALMPEDKNYLDPSETTIAGYLKKVGYQTAIIGKWHLGLAENTSPTGYGFDDFTGTTSGCVDYFTHSYGARGRDWYVNDKPSVEKGYSTDLLTNHAIQFVNTQSIAGNPFFLYLPYNAPHYGKTNPDRIVDYTISLGKAQYKGLTDLNTLQVPHKYIKRFLHIKDPYRRAYAAMVSSLDDNIGRLMEVLKKKKLLDNTIVWFISDNGGYSVSNFSHSSNGILRGEKASLFEGGIRVPSMISWKNKIKGNRVESCMSTNLDVLPTLMALAGAPPIEKSNIDGVDLSPLLLKNTMPSPRVLYWKFKDQQAMRKGEWKLILDKSGFQLFNLKNDPQESNDLFHSQQDIVKKLKLLMFEKEL